MNEVVYDMKIGEVAEFLGKSDRQVRRYVKEKKIMAKPVRLDGHIKLLFNREDVTAFRDKFDTETTFKETGKIIVDAKLIDENQSSDSEPIIENADNSMNGAVKYVIDALRAELSELKHENKELHYQLEQRSGQVGFLQAKVEAVQEELKALMPAEKEKLPPWYRRIFKRTNSE